MYHRHFYSRDISLPSGKSKKFLAGLFSLSALKSLFKADKENQARDLLKFDLRFK